MRVIKAKFHSTCLETGKTIRKGEQCLWNYRTKKVFHVTSKRFKNFDVAATMTELETCKTIQHETY